MELLDLRQGGLAATLEGGFPELRATVWQSEASVQAAVQALTPQMTENKKRVGGRQASLLGSAASCPCARWRPIRPQRADPGPPSWFPPTPQPPPPT